MTQIAADTLGLPIEDVTFELGDSSLPQAPVEGGSFTAATVGSAVKAVCDEVGKKLFKLAQKMERLAVRRRETARRHVRRRANPVSKRPSFQSRFHHRPNATGGRRQY